MNDVLLASRSSLESKSIGISMVRVGRKRPPGRKYMGDRYRLEHALLHIISNAIKQAPFGTSIMVTVQEKDEAMTTISNTNLPGGGGDASWSFSSSNHLRSSSHNPSSTSNHGSTALQALIGWGHGPTTSTRDISAPVQPLPAPTTSRPRGSYGFNAVVPINAPSGGGSGAIVEGAANNDIGIAFKDNMAPGQPQQQPPSNSVTPRGSMSNNANSKAVNMSTMLSQNLENWGLLGSPGPGKVTPVHSTKVG